MASKTATEARWAVLLASLLTSFLIPFSISSVNIALPAIGSHFDMDAVNLGWVTTVYLLAAAVFLVPVGRLADIYGRKRVFIIGTAIFTLACLVNGFAPTTTTFILARVLLGIGASMIFGTSVAILVSAYPSQDRGRVLGLNAATVYFGLALGPLLGGLLTSYLGWQSVFWVNVPLGLLAILVTLLKIKQEWAEAEGEKFDLVGSLVFCPALTAIVYGLSKLPASEGYLITGAGLLGLLIFVMVEKRVASPVLKVSLFSNGVFAFSNLAALINFSATYAITFLFSLYLQYIKHFSPQIAGLILVPMPVMQAVVSPIVGRLSDRLKPQYLAGSGMGILAFGLLPLAFLNDNTAMPLIFILLAVLGLGIGLFASPNTNAVMGSVERKFYGVASGTLGTMRLMGQMFSMAIAMLIFALVIGHVQISPEQYPQFVTSTRIAFTVFSILCFAGIFASLAGLRGKKSISHVPRAPEKSSQD